MRYRFAFFAAALSFVAFSVAAAYPAQAEEEATAGPSNKNSLLVEHRDAIKLSCSSHWTGWPIERMVDGKPTTSWFSATGDAAALGKTPWVAVQFPKDVTVGRVTLLSNREPPWEVGYTILVGRLELLDASGEVLYSRDDELGGERSDLEIRPKEPIRNVRTIRFTSLRDEGDKNPYRDIAIGEMLVE